MKKLYVTWYHTKSFTVLYITNWTQWQVWKGDTKTGKETVNIQRCEGNITHELTS